MGLIIAKFRKKKSNSELLEKIDKEITTIESFRRNTEEQRKKIVGQFLVGSVGIYIFSAVLFYFYFYPKNVKERLLYLMPFFLAPIFIFFMKRLLTMYYNRKLSKNQNKIVDLRTEKKKLLEDIMETETYKVARSILEKYAPEHVRKVSVSQELTPIKASTLHASSSPLNQSELRNRFPVGSRLSLKPGIMQTPSAGSAPGSSRISFGVGVPLGTPVNRSVIPMSTQLVASPNKAPMTPMSLYIPSKDRTILDKMVDYLIGDGPNNRYALICKQCSGHNGMALMDEFEYISFKCCYCFAINPARKKRPIAPKLESESPQELLHGNDTSESEKNSGSDSEEDVKLSPTLETLYKKEVEDKLSGNDEATISSDNEPNDFDKLSDVENPISEVDSKDDLTLVGDGESIMQSSSAAQTE